jgi:hypothetical protein
MSGFKRIKLSVLSHRPLLVDANDADYRFTPRNGPILKGSISETFKSRLSPATTNEITRAGKCLVYESSIELTSLVSYGIIRISRQLVAQSRKRKYNFDPTRNTAGRTDRNAYYVFPNIRSKTMLNSRVTRGNWQPWVYISISNYYDKKYYPVYYAGTVTGSFGTDDRHCDGTPPGSAVNTTIAKSERLTQKNSAARVPGELRVSVSVLARRGVQVQIIDLKSLQALKCSL